MPKRVAANTTDTGRGILQKSSEFDGCILHGDRCGGVGGSRNGCSDRESGRFLVGGKTYKKLLLIRKINLQKVGCCFREN